MIRSDFKQNFSFNSDNRINLVLAVIFLLCLLMIGRLFYLQVINHDYYTALAASQHEMTAKLMPQRGKIFLQNPNDEENKLYPAATNKDFALIYIVPKDIIDKDKVIESLYYFFKKTAVEKEVDDLLKAQELDRLNQQLTLIANYTETEKKQAEAQISYEHEQFITDYSYLKIKEERRQEMINDRKQAIVTEYLKAFNKENDPYEEVQKKVDLDVTKQFHLSLLSDDWQSSKVKPESMELKNNQMYIKDVEVKTGKENYALLDYPGVGYIIETGRYYQDDNVGSQLLGFVGYGDAEPHGSYGLEGFFDNELFGRYGTVTSEHGAGGLMIINNREAQPKQDGDDLVLTIDHSAQYFVCNKIKESVEHYNAESGTIIVMNPKTGALLALCSYPDFDPNNYGEVKDPFLYNNPAIFDEYEPGSVMKPVTMASAVDQGKVTPTTTYFDDGYLMIDGWKKPVKNFDFDTAGGHGITNMIAVLEQSLNTGAVFAMRSIGGQTFADYVKAFGFGDKTGIELEGESSGNVSTIFGKKNRPVAEIYSATASFGQGITVTPLQMITAYAVLANGGELVKPYVVKEIIHADGSTIESRPTVIRRVIESQTAAVLTSMLTRVVESQYDKLAAVPGYYVAGKTGTAQIADSKTKGYFENQFNHTYVGFAPSDDARFVVLVRLEKPKGVRYASSSAAPIGGDVMKFLLDYYQVPKTRK
jgi:cell division protein FtsI/penicillin-binding protein 2